MTTQSKLKEVMNQSAEAAKAILLKHFGKIKTYQKKGPKDLVTIADQQSDDAVVRIIRDAFPDHAILSEEGGESKIGESEFCWVIDPLDGTTNFAHGVPFFAISIGLMKEGERFMGLVVDPTRDDWFFAQKGKGAFLNNKRIHVSKVDKLADALMVTGFPYVSRKRETHFTDIIAAVLKKVHGVSRLGAAALDLSYVAAGRYEGFWEEGLCPWDVAAGSLLVEEAGGQCGRIDRKKFLIDGNQIFATNSLIHAELMRTIKSVWRPFDPPLDQ